MMGEKRWDLSGCRLKRCWWVDVVALVLYSTFRTFLMGSEGLLFLCHQNLRLLEVIQYDNPVERG